MASTSTKAVAKKVPAKIDTNKVPQTTPKKAVKKTSKKATPKKKTTRRASGVKAPKKTKASKPRKTASIITKKDSKAASTQSTEPVQIFNKAKVGLDRHKAERQGKRQPLGHLLLEQKLRDAGFRGGISTDKDLLEKYSYDESIFSVRPQIILQPKHQKDIETAVTLIAMETHNFPALSLTPRAAGTGLSGGSLTDSIVLDVTKHMDSIGDLKVSKGKATFTCQPGAMWRDVEKMLKKKNYYLPSYPASKDICSIGGAIGNNAAGPDSLRYGHCADWVESIDITLYDGNTYTVKPLSYNEYQALIKKDTTLAMIAEEVFTLIAKHEKTINNAKPHTKKNSAGYALWDVLDTSVTEFKKGNGTFDLTRIISGSQGTIGVITSLTMRAEPISTDTELIVVPVFDLMDAGAVIKRALKYDPTNVELFDGLTFNLALSNPGFFKDRLGPLEYYKVMFSMYTTYHVRWGRRTPEFTILITIDRNHTETPAAEIVADLQQHNGKKARSVKSKIEEEMFWQIRRASYTLSKFQDKTKRPAAFLEDMTVPPENLSKFFAAIKKLLKKYGVTAAVHGHGGNGHLHFYPLLDFTNKTTPKLVEKMADDFFATAVKFDGNICGEHNDGIIRTPHLSKMFNKTTLSLFETLEHICDPDDIFNPGKKVNPRFDVKETLRTIN